MKDKSKIYENLKNDMIFDEDKEIKNLLLSIEENIDAIHNFELNKFILISMVGTLAVFCIKIIFAIYYTMFKIGVRGSKEERELQAKICKELYNYC